MFSVSFNTIILVFTAGLSFAQFIPSISPGCQATLVILLQNPDVDCLNPSPFLSLSTGSQNTSMVSFINNWATGLCSTAPCTNETIAEVVSSIAAGCSSEFMELSGPNDLSMQELVQSAQTAYPTERKALCLQNASSHQLCITESLTNTGNMLGTLSIVDAINVFSQIRSLNSLPANVTCTDCIKETYNIVRANFPGYISDIGITSDLKSQCGPNFTNGEQPSDITSFTVQGSLNVPTTNRNVAVASFLSRGGTTAITLIAVSTIFGVLA